MKITSKVKNILLTLGLMASTFGCLISSTLAWITTSNKVSVGDASGYTQGAYFARGRGTSDDPYILNAPIHLYNLAWLQEMGKFNVLSGGKYGQVYFEMEADIDVTGTEYQKLPPIGTKENPFLGNFDGKGHTISGVKTCNALGSGDNAILRKPSSVTTLETVNIMGVFGVVGSYEGSPATATYNTSVNEIKNFNIKNYTVVSSSPNLLVGAVAGYINGNVEGVTVSSEGNGITFDVGNTVSKLGTFDNLSDYGLVGYATEDYRTELNNEKVEIYNTHILDGDSAGTAGGEDAWGGNVTAGDLSNRINTFGGESGNKTSLKWENDAKKRTAHVYKDPVTGEDRYLDDNITERYTDAELQVGASQWADSSDPLKGKVVYGSDEDNLYGVIDRPKSKGITETLYTLGGTSGGGDYVDDPDAPDAPGGGGAVDNPGSDADATGHPSFYIAPSTDPSIPYQYIKSSGWGFSGITTNINEATTFERNDDYFVYRMEGNTRLYIGTWGASDGTTLQVNNQPDLVLQDWGIFLRLTERTNPNSQKTYYFRYVPGNGGGYQLTSNRNLANVVFIDGKLRIDPTKGNNTRIAPPTIGPSISNNVKNNNYSTSPAFADTYRAADNLIPAVRYFAENPQGPEKPPILVSARDEGAEFSKAADGTIAFWSSNWNNSLNIGYGWADPNYLEQQVTVNSNLVDRFRATADGKIRLYLGGQNRDAYLYYDGRVLRSTNDQSKINVTFEEDAVKGNRLKIVVLVEPGALGDDDWVVKTTTKKHDERVGSTYLPLKVYETTPIPGADQTSFWNNSTLNPERLTPGLYTPTPTNNGYIVGGTKNNSADLTNAAAIKFNQFNSNAVEPFGGKNFDVVTVKPNGDFTYIKDDYNSAGGVQNPLSHVQDKTKHTIDDLGLQRYKESRATLEAQLGTNQTFMRFNGVDISKDELVTADYALFNQHIYKDYELPESSFDFKVEEDTGIFNMFTSAYREGADCTGFASFYQIFRDGDEKITEIKRVSKIYANASGNIAYQYFEDIASTTTADGYFDNDQNSVSITGYTLKFDMAWLESPGFTNSHAGCYYFEWPVSQGEFAIASTPNGQNEAKNGYMYYVGIGAPVENVQRTQIYEKYVKTKTTSTVVKGVSFVSDISAKPSPDDNLAIKIENGFTGTISITANASGKVVIEGFSSATTELNYKKFDTVFIDGNSSPGEIDVTTASTIETTVETVTYIDGEGDNKTTSTITKTTVNDNGVLSDPVRTGVSYDADGTKHEGYENAAMNPTNSNVETVLYEFNYTFVKEDTIELTVSFKLDDGSVTTGSYYVTVGGNSNDMNITFTIFDNDEFGIYINDTLVETASFPVASN
ncbi:MAG: hypothetical protein MJ190_00350 [Bacilli bacterium]|nr:hypothetical protein [Bacilli bacterium]